MNPKALCPRCRRSGFRQDAAPDGRPQFTCTGCDYRWTNGHDGGEYAQFAQKETA